MSIKIENTETQCNKALKLLIEEYSASFCRNEMDKVFVTLRVYNHYETHSVESDTFKKLLGGIFYKKYNRALNKDVFNQVIEIVSYEAIFENYFSEKIFNRIGYDDEGDFYYDLTNQEWEMVKISEDDYKVDVFNPVKFVRHNHHIPQIEPNYRIDDINNIEKLSKYFNIKNDWFLFICWLISCFVPDIPHPILILQGEMGSAKSTTFSFIKKILDPSVIETLTMPRDQRSLAVVMQNHWFLPFDNISYISEEISDILCRAVTGTAIQERKLHTNGDDFIFKIQRVIGLNGINQVANKPDLIDRSIIIELDPIHSEQRKELSELKKEFEHDLPDVLGSIFKILSVAKKFYGEYKPMTPQRMADFQRWGCAIAIAWKGEQGGEQFLNDYAEKTNNQKTDILHYDIVTSTLISYMESRSEYIGTMTNLLSELKEEAEKNGIDVRYKNFPHTPRALSAKLNEMCGNLKTMGIDIEKSRSSDKRIVTVINNKYMTAPQFDIKDYIPNKNSTDLDDNEEVEVDFD